mmetsp:Transcript_16048/g.22855  ORF Transcript_16048/g.22855 Transcript_16048/m.22855 type:complete len:202 (-) Transcript_16048:345-950(-)|eukprot:CAMPEP_0184855666 /NCGR_PEP_ID=MMETSP0580-20130426/834_1 /TAXON_ID=1118495 /ORGANISM="Dactyliosolen fragilissimus" /LENGTH=201 /DNA_ID=CAMNT_0027350231 /DNA_START=34 /DNA_END=639 /DNA_ORIENTATION=+
MTQRLSNSIALSIVRRSTRSRINSTISQSQCLEKVVLSTTYQYDLSFKRFITSSITTLDEATAASQTSPHVQEIFQKISKLDLIEVNLLTELVNERLGITVTEAQISAMARGAGGPLRSSSEEAPAEEEVKTAFDLKLTGFDAKAKIKVIKEVRAITGLGLKEAKEMVEGAPKTLKKGIKKEEAEELKQKLEGVGATIEID